MVLAGWVRRRRSRPAVLVRVTMSPLCQPTGYLRCLQWSLLPRTAGIAALSAGAASSYMSLPSAKNWIAVTPSRFPWEQDALDFVHEKFATHPDYFAWSNFEFIGSDGTVNEVDLLVASPWGVFLIEIKSRPGKLSGDNYNWTFASEDGRRVTDDNPLILANRKCKRLKDLLGRQPSFRNRDIPFIQALVFCSAPGLVLQLPPDARHFVCVRDEPEKGRLGIRSAIFQRQCPGLRPATERLVDGPTLKAFVQAMAQAGVRRQRRRVGDFILDQPRFESPTGVFQDWEAHHSTTESARRLVRIYLSVLQATKDEREAVAAAAQREFHTLSRLNHPGILKAQVPASCDLGQAIIFEFDERAQRLDHFLAENREKLDVGARLQILSQVADAIRYAHGKDVVHRALCPQAIYVVREKSGALRTSIYNWHTGARLPDGSFTGLTNFSVSMHAGHLVEEPARAYIAPESLAPNEEPAEAMDVFSLGALAYLLFGDQAPAGDATELLEKLKTSSTRSLDLREIRDGVSERIARLVSESTRANVFERISLDTFLEHLVAIEDELTRPEHEVADPHDAREGSVLANGFTVERVLGRGASARALLVKKGDVRCVLKVARDPSFNRRLDQEFQTLKQLDSPNIVKAFDRYEINGLTSFTVELAGERTLARMLKEDGPPDLELLQRYGEELLGAIEHLDKQGLFHRDIKPENIGIGESGGARSSKRLRLFDFSLAAASPTELRVGTLDYLDPFLPERKARRYDLSAELFSAAMTLHEIATGERARWKGGQPQLTSEEITLRAELFDADLRDQFTDFFRTALNRDYRKRFDNVREMLRKWSGIFETVDRPSAHTEHDHTSEDVLSEEVLKYATPATQLSTLMLSTRLMNVLERLSIHSVADLLRFRFGRFEKFRGVGRKTQLELIKVMHRLRQRFPEAETGQPEAVVPGGKLPVGQETIEVLAQHALLIKRGRARETEAAVLHPFLGVEAGATDQPAWPSQSDLAASGGVTRQRIGQIITEARQRWKNSAPLEALRGSIAEVLVGRGGVMVHTELVAHIISVRGSAEEEPRRTQLAHAAVRAAVEAEHASEQPRFDEYRSGDKIFVALHPELRTYAVKLGVVADRLAATDPLPTPSRVLDELRAVVFPAEIPELAPPTEARLRQLAVSAAARADLSSRGEVYPPGLPAEKALPLARNGLFGDELTVQEIERRLRARFPKCGPLPPRPQLDAVLKEAGFDFEWQPLAADQKGAYRSPLHDSLSSSYSIGTRKPTQFTVLPGAATDPEIAQAAAVERRLRTSQAEGGYLVLTAEAGQPLDLALQQLTTRFEVEICDLDALLLDALRAEVEAMDDPPSWDVVLAADAAPRDSADWQNLQYLVERALPKVEQRLRRVRQTCLALHPGLLARYGHMNLIAGLAADIGRAGGPGGLWVLAPANDAHPLPTINGVPIPLTNPSQHTRLTLAWLRNEHRAGVPTEVL